MAPKQTDPQFKLRMTPEIKEAIEKAAKENNRSMNAEILSRLESSFKVQPKYSDGSDVFLDLNIKNYTPISIENVDQTLKDIKNYNNIILKNEAYNVKESIASFYNLLNKLYGEDDTSDVPKIHIFNHDNKTTKDE